MADPSDSAENVDKVDQLDLSKKPQSVRIDTTLLRFFAITLIFNSHLAQYYPISHMAFGGMLGNSIFFLVSGLGLSLSAKRQSRGFFSWIYRRAKRIYPALFIVTFVYFILVEKRWDDPFLRHLGHFIWPTNYTFLTELLAYYIAFFFISRFNSKRVYLSVIAALSILYIGIYATSIEVGLSLSEFTHPLSQTNWVFYFGTMLFGGYLGLYDFSHFPKKNQDLVVLASLLFFYFSIKALMSLGVIQGYYFFMHLALVPTLFFLLKCFSMDNIITNLLKDSFLHKLINAVAGITLEIYIVHICLLEMDYAKALFFPLNILVLVTTSVLLAIGVSQICQRLPLFYNSRQKKRDSSKMVNLR